VDSHGDGAGGRLTQGFVGLAEGRVTYERRGDGPPLVLLHGAMGDSREWNLQLDALADEFTTVAWDAPGCGGSFDPPDDFGLDGYADSLATFISRLGLEKPHVMGLSFGSGLALALFHRHPGRVRSLVLLSAYAGWAGSLGREEAERRRRWGQTVADLSPRQVVADFAETLFTPEVPPEIVQAELEVMRDFRPTGVRAMANAFADADLREVLPTIDVPTLLVHGDADQRAPLEVAEELHARIPWSKLVVIPGSGHMVTLEASERVNDEVRRFLGT
jgi:pimeloyl-ACP methyl ester carboxylesterase